MPVREKNGIVHRVANSEGSSWYGMTACGLLYQRKRKNTTWKTLQRGCNPPVHRMCLSSRVATCLLCALGTRKHARMPP